VHTNFINLVARSALNIQADLTDLVDLAAQNCMRVALVLRLVLAKPLRVSPLVKPLRVSTAYYVRSGGQV